MASPKNLIDFSGLVFERLVAKVNTKIILYLSFKLKLVGLNRWVGSLLGFLLLSVVAGSGFSAEMRRDLANGESYDDVVFEWPSQDIELGRGRSYNLPYVKLQIPREFVDVGGLELDSDGRVRELSIKFELPGPVAFSKKDVGRVGVVKTKSGKKSLGKFYVVVRGGSTFDYSRMRDSVYREKTAMGHMCVTAKLMDFLDFLNMNV